LLSDNGIWIDFIYFPILLSFSSAQLTKVIHLTRLKIQKVKTFALQVTIFDSAKIMDYLKISHMYLNFNILELFLWNGTLIAIS
jgi:hypothetical protein